MEWKMKLPDILPGRHGKDPTIDDDIVEVYGPAEMLGAIGGSPDPEPDDDHDPDQDQDRDLEQDNATVQIAGEVITDEPALLYGPVEFFASAPPVPPAYGPAQPFETIAVPAPDAPDDN